MGRMVSKRLPCRYTGNNTFIGPRESEKEAVDRASKVFFGSGVGKDTYVLLVIGLTPEALAHFTAEAAGESYQFASMLHKVTYPGKTDWKVWHFCGDFPLDTPGVVWHFCGDFPLGASCVCAASHAPPVGLGCVTPTGAFPGVGLGGCSAPRAALALFAAVHADDALACDRDQLLPRGLLGNRDYIGFRESVPGAMERASKVFSGSAVNKSTFVVVKLSLSAEALARFTAASAGVDHQFASMLHRRTYPDDSDWKVWHFCGDFPLGAPGVCAEWQEIV